MSRWQHRFTKVQRALIAFYPPRFRAEFGPEMQDVFAAALTAAQGQGGVQPWRLFWREVRGWPGSVLREHLRARRRAMTSNGFVEEKPLTRIEWLAALIIFVLPLSLPLIGALVASGIGLPSWLDYGLRFLLLGTLLLALGLAIVKGLPRWSLPYLGFLLSVGLVLGRYDRIWSWLYPFFIESFGPRTLWSLPVRILYSAAFEVIFISAVLLAALILVNLLRLLPHTRGVWRRIRMDWTQFSFLLYGGLVFSIVILFDEYHYDHGWQAMALICLALGAWLYLRAKGQRQRILALVCGATGAMWTVTLAKWVLIPLQEWPAGWPVSPSETTRWLEVSSAMIIWLLFLIILLAPALLTLLPRAPEPIATSEGKPIAA